MGWEDPTAAHDFNRKILQEIDHRPWPMPARPWLMTQTWHDLLFAHWPLTLADLRPNVPPTLPIDLFDGRAWIGIVPFRMTNVAPRGVPSLPWISEFPELNVRTYVRIDDKPGVFFFSLDAGNLLAVQAAWLMLSLPYYSASMNVVLDEGEVRYSSRRLKDPGAQFIATYRPTGDAFTPRPGSLEYFLTERYCLYALNHRGRLYRLDIHHPPWPLQRADAKFVRNTMADAAGIALPAADPLLHFARRQDMVAWGPEKLQA